MGFYVGSKLCCLAAYDALAVLPLTLVWAAVLAVAFDFATGQSGARGWLLAFSMLAQPSRCWRAPLGGLARWL